MNAVRAPWSSASFLLYLGGLTVFAAGLALLGVESEETGAFGFVVWSGLVLLVFAAVAEGLRRTGHAVAAGLFAFNTVIALVVFVGAILEWFGWLADTSGPVFGGFHVSKLILELLVLAGSLWALSRFRFPLLAGLAAAGGWFFVTDFLSGGGSWTAIVTIAVGLVLLLVAVGLDAGASPFAFWPHVVAGLTIGGGFLWFFHDGDFDWILVAVAAFLYIGLGARLMRSSWVVLGAWALLQVATHFADKWAGTSLGEFFPVSFLLFPFFGFGFDEGGGPDRPWAAPVTYAVLGFVFVGVALLIARRRRDAIPAAELL